MKKILLVAFFFLLASFAANSTTPDRKGWWKFDDPADMLKAETGSDLELTGEQESVDGPVDGNLATQIGPGSFLTMAHGIDANGGGALVNEYSIQIDFSVPETGIWHTFFQITPDNSDDGDLFTNLGNSIGVWEAGYSADSISADIWYRMILSVKNGEFFKIYMNGELWLDAEGRDIDGRYGLLESILLFADNDGEDGIINCSEVGIWDLALTADEVAELGDASAPVTGIIEKQTSVNSSTLGQNYPNPFSYSTTFPYEIREAGSVMFRIFDLAGNEIEVINEGIKSPGKYTLELNSDKLQSGMYYLQMTTNQGSKIQKMTLIR